MMKNESTTTPSVSLFRAGAAWVLVGIFLPLVLAFGAGCVPDEGGDAASDDDDDLEPDDDTSDDDSATDDDADDDTDDDTDDDGDDDLDDDLNDDVDDDMDDDADDDTAPPICEGPSDGLDACADQLFKLYCGYELPVILGPTVFSQSSAVSTCRDGTDIRWADIVECAVYLEDEWSFDGFGGFVLCLADKGWPSENSDIFDVERGWEFYDDTGPVTATASAFNYWLAESHVAGQELSLAGGITDLSAPVLRAGWSMMYWGGSPYPTVGWMAGDSTTVTDDLVIFWMEGWIVTDDPERPPMEYVEWELHLVAAAPE